MSSTHFLILFLLLGACADSAEPSADAGSDSGPSDAGSMDTGAVDTGLVDTGAMDTGAMDTGAMDDAGLVSTPGQLACGTSTCAVPGELCCHGSASPGGTDRCEPDRETCGAPNRACDEPGDCAANEVCCTGAGALPADSPLDGFVATFCIARDAPTSCIPRPGVGNSSRQVCVDDGDCEMGECTLASCHGEPLGICGGDCG